MSALDRTALLADLERMPDLVAGLARGVAPERLASRGDGDEFSFTGHACHLRDLEVEGYAARIRRLATEERPSLPGFDGARVAAERDYDAQDFGAALAAFAEARRANVAAVRALAPAAFLREGRFEETGATVTIDGVLAMMREHDREHLAQLRARRVHARCP